MMLSEIHLHLQIITNPVYQIYFKERLPSNEVEYNRFKVEKLISLVVKNVVYC